jgi:hypothetical protein
VITPKVDAPRVFARMNIDPGVVVRDARAVGANVNSSPAVVVQDDSHCSCYYCE